MVKTVQCYMTEPLLSNASSHTNKLLDN